MKHFVKSWTSEDEHINQAWLNQMRESLIKGKGFLMISGGGFFVGQEVFSVINGYGTVLETKPECEHDTHPVMVGFGDKDNEVVDFFTSEGLDLDDAKVLFHTKSDAINHIRSVTRPVKFTRIINLYNDGKLTDHSDEKSSIAGQVFEETESHGVRQLVKRHKVEWGA